MCILAVTESLRLELAVRFENLGGWQDGWSKGTREEHAAGGGEEYPEREQDHVACKGP